jgi:hypothetical protein
MLRYEAGCLLYSQCRLPTFRHLPVLTTSKVSWFFCSFLIHSAKSTSMESLPYSKPVHYQPSFSAPFWAMLHPWAALHNAEFYTAAPDWATLHPTELHCILFRATLHPVSYTAPSELHCTPLSCATFYLATLHPTELYHTLLSHTTPCWATLHSGELFPPLMLYPAELPPSLLHHTELCYKLLNYAAFSDQCCTYLSHWALHWTTLHLTKVCCTLLSYAAPTELCCTMLSPWHPYGLACLNWATVHPT